MKKTIAWMNKYSLGLQFLLSCFLCFLIECFSRHSLTEGVVFITNKTTVYLYNSLIIFATFLVVYLFKKRLQMRITLSAVWLFLGIINGCVLAARVTPFNFADIKLVGDLFAMKSNYFTVGQAILVIIGVAAFIVFDILLFVKGPSYKGNIHRIFAAVSVASCFIWLPFVTQAAVNSNVIKDYFENIADGYQDYGFVYGFSTSVVDRGMSKPSDYSEAKIDELNEYDTNNTKSTLLTRKPNVILILLESFVDPSEVNYLNCSIDPVPTFHKYEKEFSTGYLQVPVVGAGTANTEFEVLTGMSMRYFGTGEYPYKTVLKTTGCESVATAFHNNGYGTHVVHNNTAKFYSRNNAFAKMGFDSFTSKEFMDIKEYTPLETWPTDNVLIEEVKKAMDATEESDFVYTITVQGHGAYPEEKVIENPEVSVSGAASEAANNQWEYYVNEIHEVDKFIANLTKMLDERGEDTMVVMFGDHLPSLNLTDEDMKSGSQFNTKYITWNNFGMKKDDKNLTSYQLMSKMMSDIRLHDGAIFKYHQAHTELASTEEAYQNGLENLQYDLLYGNRYTYDGAKYEGSQIEMGVVDIVLDSYEVKSPEEVKELELALLENTNEVSENDASISGDSVSEDTATKTYSERLYVYGENFTQWSKIYVNGEKVPTRFIDTNTLAVKTSDLNLYEEANTIVVNQVGSGTIFRSSNELPLNITLE